MLRNGSFNYHSFAHQFHQKSSGTLNISIYRKPTPTDCYLLFSSNHPQVVKEGIFSCLLHRAQTVAQQVVNMVTGEERLRGILEGMGYPDTIVKTASKPNTTAEPI